MATSRGGLAWARLAIRSKQKIDQSSKVRKISVNLYALRRKPFRVASFLPWLRLLPMQDLPLISGQSHRQPQALRAPAAICSEQEFERLHEGIHRLSTLYKTLLGRNPSKAEMGSRRSAYGSRFGMLLTMVAVGLSREARSRKGWIGRLVRCADASQSAPKLVRRWLTQPAVNLLAAMEERRPSRVVEGASPTTVPECPESSEQATKPPLGLTIVGYLSGNFGLAEAARSLARSCMQAGIPVNGVDVCLPTTGRRGKDGLSFPPISEPLPIQLLYVNAEEAMPTKVLLSLSGRQPTYSIGFWHWEQPQIPLRHHAAFAELQEVWVPSTFVQDAVTPVSPIPVFKIPHAVQFSPSPQATRETFGLPRDRQLVLVMFDFCSYQVRKNPQAAIAAFRLAARKNPSLGLVVKTQSGDTEPEALAELRASLEDLPHVTFLEQSLTRQHMWDLQSCCDIFLSLHRAEGFGLGPAEMMYLGKTVVATGWSANMDFMNTENSLPVRFSLAPLAEAVGPYDAGPLWAEADIEHAAWCLHQLAEDHGLAARIGAKAREDICRTLDPLVVGRQVANRLKVIGHWHNL